MNEENGFTQQELKSYYEYYMENFKSHIENDFERAEFVKAKVTNVGEVKEVYGLDTGYQDEQQYTVPYKYSKQSIEVEIFEGVVVSWREVRCIWQLKQNIVAQFLQLLVVSLLHDIQLYIQDKLFFQRFCQLKLNHQLQYLQQRLI